MPTLDNNMPDGTSSDNSEIAKLALHSLLDAEDEGRATWLDHFLNKAMLVPAIEDSGELILALTHVQNVAQQWQDAIRARQAVSA